MQKPLLCLPKEHLCVSQMLCLDLVSTVTSVHQKHEVVNKYKVHPILNLVDKFINNPEKLIVDQ